MIFFDRKVKNIRRFRIGDEAILVVPEKFLENGNPQWQECRGIANGDRIILKKLR